MSFHIKDLDHYPTQSGVYLMKDETGSVLYVGKAKNLKSRLKQYFATSGDARAMIPYLIRQIATIETIITFDDKEALLLENTLIKKHRPKYNVLLKDDKTYLSLYINPKAKWPKITLVRSKAKPKDKGLYFGPYTQAYAARETLDLLSRLFPLRQCSDEEFKRRTRPCLLYGMKRCIAPCVGKCTQEEYALFVEGVIEFLKGHDKTIVKNLEKALQEASDLLEFEKAGAILQTLNQVKHVIASKQTVVNPFAKDLDAIGFYRSDLDTSLVLLQFREGSLSGIQTFFFTHSLQDDEEILSSFLLQHYQDKKAPKLLLTPFDLADKGALEELLSRELITPVKGEKKQLLELALQNAKSHFLKQKAHSTDQEALLLDLQERLKLSFYPKVIECFDTSNLSGSDLVACKVSFVDGKKNKAGKRLYRIKGVKKSDDYLALKEVLTRRLVRGKEEEDLPDLIIVDGGKGQLNIALEVLHELEIISIDVIALAKEEARHDKGMTLEKVFIPHHKDPVILPLRSSLLFFLQKIRDEAHSAAIAYQKTKRKSRLLTSELDAIKGIGPIKKKRLLLHFGSVANLKRASIEEIASLKGITEKEAKALLSALSQERPQSE